MVETAEGAEADKIYLFKWKVPAIVVEICKLGFVFLLGLFISELMTDFMKALIGRLRPNFIDLCKPDFNCSSLTNPIHYVADYKCTNPLLKNEKSIR